MTWQVSDNFRLDVEDSPATEAPPPIEAGQLPGGYIARLAGPGFEVFKELKITGNNAASAPDELVQDAGDWMELNYPQGGDAELRVYDGGSGECVQRAVLTFVP